MEQGEIFLHFLLLFRNALTPMPLRTVRKYKETKNHKAPNKQTKGGKSKTKQKKMYKEKLQHWACSRSRMGCVDGSGNSQ